MRVLWRYIDLKTSLCRSTRIYADGDGVGCVGGVGSGVGGVDNSDGVGGVCDSDGGTNRAARASCHTHPARNASGSSGAASSP